MLKKERSLKIEDLVYTSVLIGKIYEIPPVNQWSWGEILGTALIYLILMSVFETMFEPTRKE